MSAGKMQDRRRRRRRLAQLERRAQKAYRERVRRWLDGLWAEYPPSKRQGAA